MKKNEKQSLDDETISEIEKVATIPKNDKRLEHINYLYEIFSEFQYFKVCEKKYGVDCVRSFLKLMKFQKIAQDTVIQEVGELFTNCYFIIRGQVDVISQRHSIVNSLDNHLNIKSNILADGTIFGEKCLIDKRKSASKYKSVTETFLVYLKRKDYIAIFETSKKNEINDEIRFFKSTKLFKERNKVFIDRIAYFLEAKEYEPNETVIKQAEKLENFYLIRRGQFQVYYTKERKAITEYDLNYFSKINSNSNERFTQRRVHELKGYSIAQDKQKVIVLGPGDTFGDLEIIKQKEESFFTIVCNLKGSVIYTIKKEVK